jgi:hypothetical protein
MRSRLLLAAIFSLTALVGGAGPATALDDSKPAYTCGLFVKDGDKDASEPNSVPPADDTNHDNMEIKGFFLKHEPAKGAEATTVNIIVKDLTTDLPSGNTAINWTLKWVLADVQYFVRAVADYSGSTAFEWGQYTATGAPAGVSGTFQYKGPTPGKLFEGPDGVVQLVIPQDIGGKAGSALSTLEVSANTGKSVVPVAATTPSRGVAYENDGAAVGKWTVAPCAPGAGPSAPVPSTPTSTAPAGGGSAGGGSGTPSATTGPAALPVKLASGKVKAPKKKSLSLKLTSTEKITGLVAQLRSKSKTVAKGKLATISGKGTLKLKLSKKLKKGKYTLDLVGKDASGAQRSTSAALTVR